jgi:hypothetical protein
MREVLPGVFQWSAFHEGIGSDVNSYYVEPAATVLDPMTPDEGLDWFDGRPLERVVLSNRHHYRHSDRFAERFGIPVRANENGMHELEGRPGIETFAFGDEVAPGIVAYDICPEWPDEGALLIAHGAGVLAIGDAVIGYGAELGFVPDQYLGDDPEEEKAVVRAGLQRLMEHDLDFDALLVGHGEPVSHGAKAALTAFAAG